MIKSFACKETFKIFHHEYSKKIPPEIQRIALRKLLMLHAAVQLGDLKIPPSNCLEPLRGKRTGQYSIRINQQWRICFPWHTHDAYTVAIIDYH